MGRKKGQHENWEVISVIERKFQGIRLFHYNTNKFFLIIYAQDNNSDISHHSEIFQTEWILKQKANFSIVKTIPLVYGKPVEALSQKNHSNCGFLGQKAQLMIMFSVHVLQKQKETQRKTSFICTQISRFIQLISVLFTILLLQTQVKIKYQLHDYVFFKLLFCNLMGQVYIINSRAFDPFDL